MSEQKYQDILAKLTLEEKASLCSGLTNWLTKPIEEKGIPSIWVSDGPSGLRKEKVFEKGVNIMQEPEPATCFPGAVTTASSWDPEITFEVGRAIGQEAKALKVSTVLGPGVNMKRNPLCGRNFEYFSEDPYLAGVMGAGWVHGVQSENVGTSLKHYLANNEEYIRMTINSIIDERALREIYMPAFEYIVKHEQPTTVMCCYNQVNGVYGSDNKYTLTDVLRDEWGFKGIVVSDWGAVNDRVQGIRAGLDLEMPGNKGLFDKHIVKAVQDGTLKEEELDRVVLRLIKFAIEGKEKEVEGYKVDLEKNHQIARKAAANSAVLLKNNDNTLPVKKTDKIAVIGQFAKIPRYQGAGSSHIGATKIVSFVDALNANGVKYDYADGYKLKGDGYKKSLIEEAKKIAKGKDKVLVFIGLTDAYESEGYDRIHMDVPPAHDILVKELLEVNKNIVVVLSIGSPVRIAKWDKEVKSILNLYVGGQAAGEAAYDVIFGDVNPSGKLAETFPLDHDDILSSKYFPMGPKNVEYRESIFIGYRYFDTAKKEVKYPFGYGLSYTTFEYSDLKLSADNIKEGTNLTVTFKVKNTGKVDGAEVCELYVKDIESTIFRPEKELKGFKKVFLKAGEEKEVSIELDSRAFSYYNVNIMNWHIESGDFEIQIGASSRDIKLKATIYVESANPDAVIPNYKETCPSYYNLDKITEIPDKEFYTLYAKPIADNTLPKKGDVIGSTPIGQLGVSPFGKFLVKAAIFGSKIVAAGTTNPEMIIQSVANVPIRVAMTMTNGLISEYSFSGLLDMLNGKKGGFRKLLKGFGKKYKYLIVE